MILLLLGLLLTVIALPVSDKKDSSPEVKSSSFFSASSEENTDAERTVLEKKLEDLLSQTEGVGKVRVLLMTGEEKDSSSKMEKSQRHQWIPDTVLHIKEF